MEQRPLEKSKKLWLLNDAEYQKYKKLISPQISLNQDYQKLTQDRVMNKIQDDQIWHRLGSRIQPLIQANQNPIPNPVPHPTTLPPITPHQPRYRSSSIRGTPTFPRLPPWDDTDDNVDVTLTESQPILGADGLPLLGAEGGGDQPNVDDVKETILNETPNQYRGYVELLYDMMVQSPQIRITSDHVYANGVVCIGRSSIILINLVKPNKTLTYRNPDLMKALSKIDGILDVVNNLQAVGTIKKLLPPSTPGVFATPPTTKKPPREYKRSPRSKAQMRQSLDKLNKWAKERGMDIDMDADLPEEYWEPSSVQKKGSGRKKRISWRSLF